MKNILLLCLLSLLWMSCEDTIEVDSGFESPTLVVDAWVDNLSRPQNIRLTQSQDYFDNSFALGIADAEVKVVVNGVDTIVFLNLGNGDYTWTPGANETIGKVGDRFVLYILIDGQNYIAETVMKRVPEIDSIAQIYEEESLISPEGIYAELFATDFKGVGDTYWIKTWKNGSFLNKPSELILVYDATFDPGSELDGVPFIFPLRRSVNPIQDEPEGEEELEAPYMVGDSVYVELHSISNEAFQFLNIAVEQMTNGQNGIFALPVANTNSNIVPPNGQEVLGFFNVAAISAEGKRMK